MSAWQIYLIGQADRIQDLCLITFALGLVLALALVAHAQEKSSPVPKLKLAALVVIAVVSLLITGFFPSGKTLAAMYVIPPIVNNEQVKADAGEIYKLAVEFAKDKLQNEGEKP